MNTIIKVLSISIVFSILNLVSAEELGLLLGLRYGNHYDVNATLSDKKVFEGSQDTSLYRTFWIRAEDGQIELAAEKTNLLVPREDGFWRVDVKHSTYNDFSEDFVWVNPAPDPDALPNPFLANQEGIEAFDVTLLVKEQGIETALGEYCNGHASREILFMGENYLSVGYVRSEMCRGFIGGSADSALQILSLDQLELIEMNQLLDNQDRNVLNRAAKDYQEKHSGSEDWGDVSSGIVRHQGQWIIKGHFPTGKELYTHFEVPVPAPESLVSNNELYPDWETIKKQVPEAIDAFSSPNKELLVVLTESSLLGFSITDGKINQPPKLHVLLKYPTTAVMTRWAEGQYVPNWTQEIQNLGPQPKKSWFTQVNLSQMMDESLNILGVVATQIDTLNIRQGLGQHTKPIGKVKKGSKLPILDVLGRWYKVKLENGVVGYAHSDYIKILPKLPYIQPACPVEYCTYGMWKLKQDTSLYAEPSLKATPVARLEALHAVEALNGEIHTSQYGEIEVVKSGGVDLMEDNKKLTLKEGDRLFDLEAVGLGMHVVWYNGELYYLSNGWDPDIAKEDALWGKELTERKTDWWVRIEVPEKAINGWIVNPEAEGMNRLP